MDALEKETVVYDGQEIPIYDASQRQRAMERDIRKTKRELSAYNAAMSEADEATAGTLKEQFTASSVKLKHQEAALREFERQTGLLHQGDRSQALGFGRSEAQKAVWANRRVQTAITSAPKGPIEKTIASQSGVSGEYKRVLETRYGKMSANARLAFDRYVNGETIANGSSVNGDYYSGREKKIHMNLSADASNPRGAGSTYFHEHGHYIDAAANYPSLRVQEFANAIREDYNDYISSYMKANGIRTKREAYGWITREFVDGDVNLLSAVTDLMEGASKGKVIGVYGHGVDYWKEQSMLPLEAFAHFYEAQSDPARIAILERYFPSTSMWFDAILEVIAR